MQAKAVQLGKEGQEARRQLTEAEGAIEAAKAAQVAGNVTVERALRQLDALNRRYEKLTAGLAKGEDTGGSLPPADGHPFLQPGNHVGSHQQKPAGLGLHLHAIQVGNLNRILWSLRSPLRWVTVTHQPHCSAVASGWA